MFYNSRTPQTFFRIAKMFVKHVSEISCPFEIRRIQRHFSDAIAVLFLEFLLETKCYGKKVKMLLN